MNYFLVFAFLFFIGSCLGWCLELLFRRFISSNNPGRKWINPGFLAGPYVPLYGFGLWGMYEVSLLMQPLLTGSRAADAAIIFVIMAIIMTIIEYIAGLIFVKGMKVKLWDYSREKLNIQGIICPKFTFIWGALGLLYFFTVNVRVEKWVMWLSEHLAFSFFVGFFFGIFIIDLASTLQLSAKLRRFAVDNELVIKYEELKHAIDERRESLEERKRFIRAFKTDRPLREYLEHYYSQMSSEERKIEDRIEEDLRKIRENLREKIREDDDEV